MFVKHPNKESIHIRTNTPTMSRDEGACKLSPICTRVVSTPNQGWGGGGEWPRQCDFAGFVAINTFRRLLRATDTCDVFSFDKDGCQLLKLSASGYFSRAMF